MGSFRIKATPIIIDTASILWYNVLFNNGRAAQKTSATKHRLRSATKHRLRSASSMYLSYIDATPTGLCRAFGNGFLLRCRPYGA